MRKLLALLLLLALPAQAQPTTPFPAFVTGQNPTSLPLGAGDLLPVIQGGVTTKLAHPFISINGTTCYLTDSCSVSTGLGTVTSVGLSVPGSSIFSVAGTPVTAAGTLALDTTGISGGIPFFDTTGTLNSSALLTDHAIMLGGGAGATPATLGSLGTTTTLLHGNASGAPSFGAVANADLVNAATTVNGQTCTLGSTCTVTAPSGSITVGTTTISGGSAGNVLYDNAGVLGELASTGSGNVVLATSPTVSGLTVTGSFTATGLVTTANLAAAGVTYTKIQNVGAVSLLGNPTGAPASPSEITLGSGLAFSGTTLTATGSGGTVTSVTCGTGLSGGAITTTGTCTLDLTHANTWTGVQTFTNGDLSLKGSSSGNTLLEAAAAASGTISFPAVTDTVAVLGTAQAWTATQSSTPQTLTISTSTFTPAAAGGNNIKFTLTAACPCTLANPSGTPIAGTSGVIEITQGTGGQIITTWGSSYLYAGGTSTIALSTGSAQTDTFSYYVRDSTHIVLTTAALNATH